MLDVHDLRLSPGTLSVSLGGKAPISAWTSDGTLIDNDAFQWFTSDPSLAQVIGPNVVAGKTSGRVLLTAKLGELQATAIAIVEPPRPPSLVLRDAPTRLRIGALGRYALAAGQPSAAWSTSNAKILAMVKPGQFRGQARGIATVCAVGTAGQHACVDVEVTK